jgi:hypothetical protein
MEDTSRFRGMVDSTSDARVVNNVMRHQYRILNDREKADMQRIKDIGLEFYEYLVEMDDGDGGGYGEAYDPRCLAMARTKIEEAVMWAVKAVTK